MWRQARHGNWKREKSIATEHHSFREFPYKERVTKRDKPTELWDDIWIDTQKSWKKHRPYQCKAIKTKVGPPLELPISGTLLQYTGKDKPDIGWYRGEVYTVVRHGFFWLVTEREFGLYITNSEYPDTDDEDYCIFIPQKDIWKQFKKV